MMNAHLVQTETVWEDKAANRRAVRRLLSGRVSPGDLVLLPEMFDTGFSFELDRTADDASETLGFLRALAAELGCTIQGSRTVRSARVPGKGLNRATIVGPGGDVLAEYDKIHPFSFGRETDFFVGGDRVETYSWTRQGASTVVCPAICYDLRFPELFRIGLRRGAEVLAIGANWPASRAEHRRTLSAARAIENQAVVLCVNRSGSDPHLTYSGGTVAFGPRGEVLGELGDGEAVLSVRVDLEGLRAWRATFPAWKDLRLTALDQ